MKQSMEEVIVEVISKYLDSLNAGRAEPLDDFLARFPELPHNAVAGLKARLGMLAAARDEPPIEERRAVGWQWLKAHLNDPIPSGAPELGAPRDVDASADEEEDMEASLPIAAAVAMPTAPATVGAYLTRTMESSPEKLQDLAVPLPVLQLMARDTSPIDVLEGSQEERQKLAKKYATQNPDLFNLVLKLVLRLRSLLKAERPRTEQRPLFVYGREAPESTYFDTGPAVSHDAGQPSAGGTAVSGKYDEMDEGPGSDKPDPNSGRSHPRTGAEGEGGS